MFQTEGWALTAAAMMTICAGTAAGQALQVSWDQVVRVSRTTPTLQVVVNPPLRPGSPIHDRVYSELQKLGADYVRYVPWLPYPKLAVAELEAPTREQTSWDFSPIDPMTADFVNATKGHPVMLNFSTIPAWLFKTDKPVVYPQDPDQVVWNYTQGTELKDPTGKQLGDYYARLVGWYVNGGFTDELGKRHESGHHYKIDYWEVLNEPDLEHHTTPEQYTERYDAIVAAIRKAAPGMKFVGMSLAFPSGNPHWFEYFLNPKNHKPGIPLDMISYHFYGHPAPEQGADPETGQFTVFEQADGFISTVRYIESIRERLSPSTKTAVNEIGVIAGGHDLKAAIPDSYWNLAGACYAYVYGQLASLGIEIAGESQLVGYPTQFPSVSMVDWSTGAPNARFRVLELLKNNFHPGDRIVQTRMPGSAVYALATLTADGEHKVLLINKRTHDVKLSLPGAAESVQVVDPTTGGGPAARRAMDGNTLTLHGLAVAVVTMRAR